MGYGAMASFRVMHNACMQFLLFFSKYREGVKIPFGTGMDCTPDRRMLIKTRELGRQVRGQGQEDKKTRGYNIPALHKLPALIGYF